MANPNLSFILQCMLCCAAAQSRCGLGHLCLCLPLPYVHFNRCMHAVQLAPLSRGLQLQSRLAASMYSSTHRRQQLPGHATWIYTWQQCVLHSTVGAAACTRHVRTALVAVLARPRNDAAAFSAAAACAAQPTARSPSCTLCCTAPVSARAERLQAAAGAMASGPGTPAAPAGRPSAPPEQAEEVSRHSKCQQQLPRG